MQTSTKLNRTQLHILQMFKYTSSKKSLEDLKDLLAKYYADLVDVEMDRVWKDKKLNQIKLKEIAKKHFRTKSRE